MCASASRATSGLSGTTATSLLDGVAVDVPRDGTIAGLGGDAVAVARFRRILARRPGFAARFFTEAEQADAGRSPDPTESLAARFAAKEAGMKALGTGLGSFALNDVEVRRAGGDGPTRDAPSLVLHRAAAAVAERRGVGPWHLSLTHTTGVAIA